MVISIAVISTLIIVGLMVTIGWQIVLASIKGIGILLAIGYLLWRLEQHGVFLHFIK